MKEGRKKEERKEQTRNEERKLFSLPYVSGILLLGIR